MATLTEFYAPYHAPMAARAAIMGHCRRAVDAMNALGPAPVLPRRGPGHPRHPGYAAWDAEMVEIGREFVRSVWSDAKLGDTVCDGYVSGTIDFCPVAGRKIDDDLVERFICEFITNARWTESIRKIAARAAV
jgi:hypothetical protein